MGKQYIYNFFLITWEEKDIGAETREGKNECNPHPDYTLTKEEKPNIILVQCRKGKISFWPWPILEQSIFGIKRKVLTVGITKWILSVTGKCFNWIIQHNWYLIRENCE